MNDKLTSKQAAQFLGVCVQRITAKLKDGHFPNATWCECQQSRLIPLEDLINDKEKKR